MFLQVCAQGVVDKNTLLGQNAAFGAKVLEDLSVRLDVSAYRRKYLLFKIS
jgi:hypothetical protein